MGCMLEVGDFEHNLHVARDGQPFPVRQREQHVHIQHTDVEINIKRKFLLVRKLNRQNEARRIKIL